MRQVDQRTGRPLVDGYDRIDALTDEELEAELTIAVAEPRHRGERLDSLLLRLSSKHFHTQVLQYLRIFNSISLLLCKFHNIRKMCLNF